jgi:hypothetical protein
MMYVESVKKDLFILILGFIDKKSNIQLQLLQRTTFIIIILPSLCLYLVVAAAVSNLTTVSKICHTNPESFLAHF